MPTHSELIDATRRIDIERNKRCLADKPDSIHDVDNDDNNAMHICVAGFASIRAPHLMTFFLEETSIDLLQKNCAGLDPLELAFTLNDRRGIKMIEPFAYDQLNKRFPLEREKPVIALPKHSADFSPK